MEDDDGIAFIASHRLHHRPCPCPLGLSRLRGLFDIPGRQVVSRAGLARSSTNRTNLSRPPGMELELTRFGGHP
jgi:hypothetical protein